jgi:outer membrane lipoprotein-sorting protein
MTLNKKNFQPLGLIAVLFLLAVAVSGLGAQEKEEIELQRTLTLMDSVRKNCHSFAARFSQKKYTAILKEFDTPEVGEFYYSRGKDGSTLLRQEATSPGRKILTIKGDEATFYQPNIKQAQKYNLGKYKDLAEFLALGICQSPAKLQETFHISYQGSESINGAPCSLIVLKPKAPNVAAHFSSITLWYKNSSGLPVQNKLQEPSGDYVLLSFFDEKLNAKIPESKFEQKLPKGVDIQRIQ